MIKRVVCILIAILITSCAARDTSNILDLNEATLKNNHDSIEQLYKVWIKPVSKLDEYGFHLVQLGSTQEWYDAQDSLKKGFVKFCDAKQAKFEFEGKGEGFDLVCLNAKKRLIGKLEVQRYEGNILKVEFDSYKRVAQREQIKEKFSAMKKHNGPTGELTTVSGERLKIIRIGNFYKPDMWFVRKSNNSRLPFSDLKKLVFRVERNSPVVDVTLLDDTWFTVNETKLGYHESPFFNVMGGDFFVVVIDNKTKQPYTKIYNWFDGIQSISFDNKNFWHDKEAYKIQSKYKLWTKEKHLKYVGDIKQKATALYTQLRHKAVGYFKDGAVTGNYAEYAYHELISMQNRRACSQSIDKGIENIEAPLQCLQAKIESKIFDNYDFMHKYPINVKESPLTSLIILVKIQADIKAVGVNR